MILILMSIKKKWWDLIAAGEKHIELRKNMPLNPGGEKYKVYVYVPEEKKVCGSFIVNHFEDVIAKTQDTYGLSKVTLEEQIQYAGRWGRLKAWCFDEVKVYEHKVDIEQFGAKRAPQSWQYIKKDDSTETANKVR